MGDELWKGKDPVTTYDVRQIVTVRGRPDAHFDALQIDQDSSSLLAANIDVIRPEKQHWFRLNAMPRGTTHRSWISSPRT
jgi:hypothetical protein